MKSSIAQSDNAQSIAESTKSHLTVKIAANHIKTQLKTLLKNIDAGKLIDRLWFNCRQNWKG